ncbi:MAG: Crp/Fnr family transcriptional regulator [Pseudomonadota bacterium]
MMRDGFDVNGFEYLPSDSTLARCGAGGLDVLRSWWTEARYPQHAQVVGADDRDDDVFFVLEGRARAATFTDGGREVRLSDITVGEGFGIFAAIDGRPRSTNVIAMEPSRFARISARNFNMVIDTQPSVARALMLYFCDRIRQLSLRVTEVTTQSAEQRLISMLLNEAERLLDEGQCCVDDDVAVVIDPIPTQQDIATIIFSQRETVGRELSRLARMGLVERRGRSLRIVSVARLRAYLGDN